MFGEFKSPGMIGVGEVAEGGYGGGGGGGGGKEGSWALVEGIAVRVNVWER